MMIDKTQRRAITIIMLAITDDTIAMPLVVQLEHAESHTKERSESYGTHAPLLVQ